MVGWTQRAKSVRCNQEDELPQVTYPLDATSQVRLEPKEYQITECDKTPATALEAVKDSAKQGQPCLGYPCQDIQQGLQ